MKPAQRDLEFSEFVLAVLALTALADSGLKITEENRDRTGVYIGSGIGGLATIGSTAPFIGLLGTVIGILNAFQSIANSKSSGIGQVAGGISEALVTTAFGLVVAIPAVRKLPRGHTGAPDPSVGGELIGQAIDVVQSLLAAFATSGGAAGRLPARPPGRPRGRWRGDPALRRGDRCVHRDRPGDGGRGGRGGLRRLGHGAPRERR